MSDTCGLPDLLALGRRGPCGRVRSSNDPLVELVCVFACWISKQCVSCGMGAGADVSWPVWGS